MKIKLDKNHHRHKIYCKFKIQNQLINKILIIFNNNKKIKIICNNFIHQINKIKKKSVLNKYNYWNYKIKFNYKIIVKNLI